MESYNEFIYVALIFCLFLIPKALERFYIPAGLTSFFLGAIFSIGFGLFKNQPTINMLAILGISSLFLFAGLEVDMKEMKKQAVPLIQHMSLQAILMALVTVAIHKSFGLSARASCLYALALVTPSTGFILDSLNTIKLDDDQKTSIKTNAIATEILALFIMFITLRSSDPIELLGSSLGIIALVIAIPFVFKFFVNIIAPYAPDSEFAFFTLAAVLAGLITYKLGAYYLVGAFIVGMSIQRFKSMFPEMDTESMIHSMKVFSAFFIPLYFFRAGSKVTLSDLSPMAILLGVGLAVIISPLRVFLVTLHRKLITKEDYTACLDISLAMIPTLVFGLVLADILKSQYNIKPLYFGALLTYTVIVTFLPGLIIKKRQAFEVATENVY